jgi:hypothetical protein
VPAAEVDVGAVGSVEAHDVHDRPLGGAKGIHQAAMEPSAAEVPGISSGPPSRTSRCVSIVLSAAVEKSGLV